MKSKFGNAFSDSIHLENRKQNSRVLDDTISWWNGSGRILIFTVILLAAFFILAVRLFQLTVINGFENRKLADENRTRELVRHAPRGLILDRTGKELVVNDKQYRYLLPCSIDEIKNGTSKCVKHISQEEGDKILRDGLMPGYFLETDYIRRYTLPFATGHVIGFTGEVSGDELNDEYYKLRGYRQSDNIGRYGIEQVYEEKLRGRDGKELVEVDANGSILRILGRDTEEPGINLTLSLDKELSEAVMRAFPEGKKGAVIVSKPKTGEILALYSSPSYDPNVFVRGISQSQYESLVYDRSKPMFNRAISGVYPPGSTYKIVTAIAALEEGKITGNTTVEDTGVLKVGDFSFANWYFTQYGRTEGPVNVVKALYRSNDIFFYKVGEMVGVEKLADWSRKIGIGKPLGLELPGEASGLMPDKAWKNNRFTTSLDIEQRNNIWYAGDTYHLSIGQGYLLTTPLQVNTYTNLIAGNGRYCIPTIEKSDEDKNKDGFRSQHTCYDLGLSDRTLDLITDGLIRACMPQGTAYPLFNFGISLDSEGKALEDQNIASTSASIKDFRRIPVACKTGTAEFGDPENKTHAWFTAYAPVEDKYLTDSHKKILSGFDNIMTGSPEISVTVLVEEAGEGSHVAAPIARDILTHWFSK